MSGETGLIATDYDELTRRSFVAEIGFPVPEMPDVDEYRRDALVPLHSRPLEATDIEWLQETILARPETTCPMGVVSMPFSPEEFKILQQFARTSIPLEIDPTSHAFFSPFIAIPNDLPEPKDTLKPTEPTRQAKNGYVYNYLTRSPGGMRTATVANLPGEGLKREGLHLDSWFSGTTVDERLAAPNRFALNLGPGDRYLLLGDFGVAEIVELLGDEIAPGTSLRTVLARKYITTQNVADLAARRVLGIKFGPGEGYIVPSEARLHDGATAVDQPSDIAFWIGRFSVNEFQPVV